ncbi:MAG TPA: hypothetical protein PL048_02940 [Leptospiraceae bacterium]|nr:hypothetical protein [Leptospiraceae bacterium]
MHSEDYMNSILMKILTILIFFIFNCSDSSSGSSSSNLALLLRGMNSKSSSSADKLSTNPFSRTVPTSFAVASSTASKTLSSKAFGEGSLTKSGTDDFPADFENKKKKFQAVLEKPENISDCLAAIPTQFKLSKSTPSCYGPTLGYANHPDGAGVAVPGCPPGLPFCLPQGDLGIWTSAEASGEACAAAQMNALVEYTANKADLAMGIFTAMACVSQKSKNSLPAKGEKYDLVQEMNSITAPSGLVFKAATMERDKTDTESRPVFFTKTQIAKKITKLDNTTSSIVFNLILKHTPASVDDYSNYKGVFLIEGQEPDYRSGGGLSTVRRGLSVVYQKSGSTLKYKMMNALYNSAMLPEQMFTPSLELNPKPASGPTAADGWANDFNVMISSIDDSGKGSVAYGWQANASDGYLRTFNVETKSDDTGTAYFGFADNNTSGTGDLKLDRMICNWAGPAGNRTGQQKVQRQTIKYDIRFNLFVPVTDNITFAPTNSCNWNFGTNPTTQFQGVTTQGITNNLIDMSAYSFSLPESPAAP